MLFASIDLLRDTLIALALAWVGVTTDPQREDCKVSPTAVAECREER